MSQNPHIDFTHAKFLRFKQAFTRALENQQSEFEFENDEFMTSYARYVVEYLDSKYQQELKAAEGTSQTSERWQQLYPETIIRDPDGWNRKDFNHSWFVEMITLEEYQRRVSLSTCTFFNNKN